MNFVIQRKGGLPIDVSVLSFRLSVASNSKIGQSEKNRLAQTIATFCPANGIYGQVGTIVFASGNYYDPFMKKVQGIHFCDLTSIRFTKRRGKMEVVWQSELDKCTYETIMDEITKNKIQMRKYRAPRPAKSADEVKEFSEFKAMQVNRNSAIRRTKCKGQGRTALDARVILAPEHKAYSCALYGETLNMNNRTVPMSEKISQYLDGSGVGSNWNNSDYRPQMPCFPERSYKAK